jgi:hypothetical protein
MTGVVKEWGGQRSPVVHVQVVLRASKGRADIDHQQFSGSFCNFCAKKVSDCSRKRLQFVGAACQLPRPAPGLPMRAGGCSCIPCTRFRLATAGTGARESRTTVAEAG